MLLTVDIGNTQTVLAVFDGDKIAHSWRVRTVTEMTADELSLLYQSLLSTRNISVTGVAACSTVPSLAREFRVLVEQDFSGVPRVFIEPGVKTGVQIATDNPLEVGTDRIMNTLAAHHLFGGPTVVVDFGTSTNFDVVGKHGEFLGGALAPGVEISVDALAQRAAQLRRVELRTPRHAIGTNTVDSLLSGIIFGSVSQVDGIVRRIQEELAEPLRAVVATGGLASLVVGEAESITHYEPDLTLIGLRLAFEKNT